MSIPPPRPAATTTRFFRIEGKVQGVGYRFGFRREALRLGLTGWVRNRLDGSVEAIVQGPESSIGALLRWARRGPPAARVEQVRVGNPPPEWSGPYTGFDQYPTA